MKKIVGTTGILMVLAFGAVAISAQTVEDQIALSRSEVRADRQLIVTASLGLTEAESKVFWPLYRDYRADVEKQVDKMWNMFVKYGETWDTMSDADASKLLNDWLSTERDLAATKQKWAKKMSKQLSPVSVARFFQIDNKLDTIIRLEAAGEIPLVVKKQ